MWSEFTSVTCWIMVRRMKLVALNFYNWIVGLALPCMESVECRISGALGVTLWTSGAKGVKKSCWLARTIAGVRFHWYAVWKLQVRASVCSYHNVYDVTLCGSLMPFVISYEVCTIKIRIRELLGNSNALILWCWWYECWCQMTRANDYLMERVVRCVFVC